VTSQPERNEVAAGDMLAAALAYAENGLKVFPLKPRAKVPATIDGLKAATSDPDAIRGWWERWPDANLAIRTGAESGVVVLDVDAQHGGGKTLAELEHQHGKLPRPHSLTGGGGNHYLFMHPGNEVRNSAGVLGHGLDVRGDGGYIVAPPSVHENGRSYKQLRPFVKLEPMPAWLVEDAVKRRNGHAEPVAELIPQGQRRATLLSLAGTLRRRGLGGTEIYATLAAVNAERGNPPLPDQELRELAHDVTGRYQPDPVAAIPTTPATVDTVDGAKLLNDLVAHLRRFMVLSDAQADTVALFTLMTHCVDAFTVVPYLRVFSPTKRTGKSRLLELLEFLVHKPVKTGGISEAALFRSLADGTVTLLFDEIGKVLGESARDRNSDIEAVLLNGYAAGTPVLRCVGEGSKQTVTPFDVFGPKVLGGTGRLDEMIVDRCLPVALKRKARTEQVERLRRRDADKIAEPFRARMVAWATVNGKTLATVHPDLPDELDDRAQDITESLLAIADVAGGDWPRRARRAVIELRGNSELADDDEIGVELLADVRHAFGSENVDRLSTERLLVVLCTDKERPWATWHRGDAISPRVLANILRPFGIRSNTLRLPDETRAKGFKRDQFEDAWNRYLPPEAPVTASLSVTP
jgi:Protein of unknown function (DUF3631)/Bifunctional DNA primase/polymerase, N-terminal/Primase C terminal 1 (PriCT-1)